MGISRLDNRQLGISFQRSVTSDEERYGKPSALDLEGGK